MTGGLAFGLLLAAISSPPSAEWARYRLEGPEPWRQVRAVEAVGYRVVPSSPDGRTLFIRVEVDGEALRDDAPFPPPPAQLPAEAAAVLAARREPDAQADDLARLLTRGCRTVLESVERVVGYTSRRIAYELPGTRPETAVSCLRSGRGSCVGRSLLAADLLLRLGVPARQVSGVLTAKNSSELGAETRAVYSASLGGVRHRWIEVWVAGLGWVPSDPGGLANTVTARHVALAEPPDSSFGLATLERSPDLGHPSLPAIGKGITLARPRTVSLLVRNTAAREGGAVVLASLQTPEKASRLAKTTSTSVRFEGIPTGEYRVLWKSPDGRVEAASILVDGPSSVDLGDTGGQLR